MKQLRISFLLTMLMSMVGAQTFAHDIEVANDDGVTIYYTYTNNNTELSVSYRGRGYSSYSNEYTGNIVIPETVTYNGRSYSVTSIGNSAFRGCSGLKSVTIPNNVTFIGNDAFYGCSGLTSVTIPNSVTSIGEYAFYGCSDLTSVHISNLAAWCKISFNSSGSNPLYYAHHLYLNGKEIKDLVIPNSVTSIGDWAFYNCSGLTSVDIPNGVTSIGQNAFGNCSGLTSVTIPNSVTSIGDWAFYNCSGLTSVIIPNSVTSIGACAFRDCSGLTSVTIPNSVTSIGGDTFSGCSSLTSVTIGNSVTSIGWHTFYGCSSLTSVTIPNSVTFIDGYAFYGCSGLTSVIIPNSVTSIGESAFEGCSGLTSVTIPNSVTSIGQNAFGNCSGLTSVIIPNSVTFIGGYAFYGCSGLTSVTIPNSVTSIGQNAFGNCSGLTSVTIGNSVTSIDWHTFYGCSSLTSVTIPNSVTFIGGYAFYGCSSLTSVTIPNSVTSIGQYAFYGCSGLTEVNFNATNCASMGAMGSVYFPVFDRCTSIRTINIGENVKNIPAYAFATCSGLTSVISELENPFEIEENVFCTDPLIYSTATLTVPHGTKEAYQATSGWNKFENIEEAMGIDPTEGDGGMDYGDDSEINNNTNLDGNVVGNIYYNIGDDDGGYSSAEGCIVINTPSADDNIDGKDIFGEDFRDYFTGIVFKIGAGSGTIKVKAETVGSMVLKVKIGDSAPMVMVLNGKLEASFPYNVSEPTNVYIYGGEAASGAPMHRASGENALKIYCISWEEEGTSIGGLTPDPSPNREGNWYTLDGRKLQGKPTQKGVYIQNGTKIVIK